MTASGAVHVTTQRRHYTGKDGRERVYETHLLRRPGGCGAFALEPRAGIAKGRRDKRAHALGYR